MSVSFCYEVVKPARPKTFENGTSSDVDTLTSVFGESVSTKDIPMLHAMHRATRSNVSLWLSIAEVLDGMPDDTTLRVWTEY